MPCFHLDLKSADPGVLLFPFLKKGQEEDPKHHKNSESVCLFFSDGALKTPLQINYGLSKKLTKGSTAFKIAQFSVEHSNRWFLSWHVKLLSYLFLCTESVWSPWATFSSHLVSNVVKT